MKTEPGGERFELLRAVRQLREHANLDGAEEGLG
jgi:hypothetical protein